MKKAMLVLAVLVAMGGLQGVAEARGGAGGMGAGSRAGSFGHGSVGMGFGDTTRLAQQDRVWDPSQCTDPASGMPLQDKDQLRDRLQDPTLHTTTDPVSAD